MWLLFQGHMLVITELIILIQMRWYVICSVVSNSLRLHDLKHTRLPFSCNSAGKNTGVGCHALLQGIFLTQALNLSLLHCRQILHHPNQEGSPFDSVFTTNLVTVWFTYLIEKERVGHRTGYLFTVLFGFCSLVFKKFLLYNGV